jgi:hypothetical protein
VDEWLSLAELADRLATEFPSAPCIGSCALGSRAAIAELDSEAK